MDTRRFRHRRPPVRSAARRLSISRARRLNYRMARRLGDAQAVLRPARLPRRIVNRLLGRRLVRRFWR